MELLNKIQKELKAPKGQFNSFGKYNYRNCEDILEAVKPLLGERGALILSDEMVQLGDRFYVKATAELSEGSKIIATAHAYAREALDKKGMDEAQITGAASSYARKYALNGLFCIDDTKDADSSDNTAKAKPAANAAKVEPPKKVADSRKSEIKALIDDKVLEPIAEGDAEAYRQYVLDNTGLKLEPENFTAIIERLKALQ